MKKVVPFLVLVVLAFFGLRCSQETYTPETDIKSTAELQMSRWTWLRSSGSIAGVTITPESSGKTMEIEFLSDSIFNKYVDGVKVYTSPYIINGRDSTIQYTTLAQFEGVGLGFDHQPEQHIQFRSENELWLIDRCCDNFTFEFVRKR